MRVEAEIKLGYKDVMFRPKRSKLKSRSEVLLERTFEFLHTDQTWTGIPVMSANMDTTGTFDMAKVLSKESLFTALHKHYSLKDWDNFLSQADQSIYDFISVSTGVSESDYENTKSLIKKYPSIRFICVDVANGYGEYFVNFVKKARKAFTDKVIIVGNVVTGEMVEELLLAGADIIKIGIGPGSACTTRVKTGVGYPQLSAIIECADAAHGLGGLIIADGGCKTSGDVAKAFGAGADFVMLGGMLAAHDESGGNIIEIEGKKFKEYYGMSSAVAMDKYKGGVAEYRASEGKRVIVPYKGPVINTVRDILGGVRSTCTYVGAKKLKELSKRTTFIRVMEQENTIFGTEY